MPPAPQTILHVCPGNQFGGVESMLVSIARSSAAPPRLPHAFACCFEDRFSRELRQSEAVVHSLPRVRLSRPWEVLRARTALRRLLATSKPSVVVTHSAWTRLAFGRSLVHIRVPTVAWIHGAGIPLSRLDRWGQQPRPNLVIVNSRHTGDLTRTLFPGSPRAVIYCPVPPTPTPTLSSRQSLRASLGATSEDTVLLMAARLEAWKGHVPLLDALATLPPSPRWTCWIAGGPQSPEQHTFYTALQQRASDLGLAHRVAFLGEREDVAQLMGAADLYCQPNLGPEPFGIVFIEALYAGLPVITTASGGALEIVDDECGRLVPPGDTPALSQTLQVLIQDPKLRERLGAWGPGRAAQLCDPAARLEDLERHLAPLTAL